LRIDLIRRQFTKKRNRVGATALTKCNRQILQLVRMTLIRIKSCYRLANSLDTLRRFINKRQQAQRTHVKPKLLII